MVFYINDNVIMFQENTTVFNSHWEDRIAEPQTTAEEIAAIGDDYTYPATFDADAKTILASYGGYNLHENDKEAFNLSGAGAYEDLRNEPQWRLLPPTQFDDFGQKLRLNTDNIHNPSSAYSELRTSASLDQINWNHTMMVEDTSFSLFRNQSILEYPSVSSGNKGEKEEHSPISPTLSIRPSLEKTRKRNSHQASGSEPAGLLQKRSKSNPAITINYFETQDLTSSSSKVGSQLQQPPSVDFLDHTFTANASIDNSRESRLKQFYKKIGRARLEKQIPCSCCGKDFGDLMQLAKHVDKENCVRENFCPDDKCPYSIVGFKRRVALRRHICNQHLKSYNLQSRSGKHSSQPDLLEVGENLAPRSNLSKFLSKVYVCQEPQCSRAFYRSDSLLRHQRCIHHYEGTDEIKSDEGEN